ncbi:hypothetical protein HMPREF3096_22785 [Klebsiella sp. HMSC25G12]|nr:hypothetical protein HMPREF3096_22785 [Klebsiella sp. HMSC25G12]
MLIGLGDGVEDGHGGQNIGCNGLGCVYLLLCIIGSGFLLRSSVVVMHYQPPKANHQADHNGADNGG